MEAILDLYIAVRSNFPEITAKADREHVRLWGELDAEFACSWFTSLANALNAEMCKGTNPERHAKLFAFISSSLENGSNEIHSCIDVSFTENLFWQVPAEKAAPYWQVLPEPLKDFYIGFHHRVPL
ncbi:DUF7674 family protein [Pseudomonas oryzae]|uniref:DUF7674 domain-containing protein n=1 Tax=Pseudomonas oryzae TaxID=1392877 RepID=A0A1H1PYU6_9PSED|nr:hypothetical protein [Pseudomonas oryzae]SDS16286.1 hypothetical protein SAMN05216221_1206 [Pseudomonas oryzae]